MVFARLSGVDSREVLPISKEPSDEGRLLQGVYVRSNGDSRKRVQDPIVQHFNLSYIDPVRENSLI
jgi:hypothetical protein